MIAIIDYGMGNLRSVSKALEHLGQSARITSDTGEIESADRLILPGVGAFGDAMAELERRGLIESIRDFAAGGRPMLGVCLGMQLVLESSEESPGVAGLGLIAGTVKRFRTDLKVPHMGWNTVRQARPAPLFRDLPDDDYFYFVHSYHAAPDAADTIAGVTQYGIDFASVLWRDNVVATQFHPEKSQKHGLAMLTNFCRM
jgi:glutamine amidotransferase